MNDEQIKTATGLVNRANRDVSDLAGSGSRPDEIQNTLVGLRAGWMAEVANMIDEKQLGRLNQIDLQQAGPRALGRKDVAASLGLSDEQTEAITTAIAAARGGRGRPAPDGGSDLTATLMNILTDEQKEKWNELLGAPFEMPQPE